MTSLGEQISLFGLGLFIGLFITEFITDKYRAILAITFVIMIASPLIASVLLDIYSYIKLKGMKHAWSL